MINSKEIFGRRLKLARQKEKLSLEELSNKTGGAVSKQTISKYEAGKAMAGSDILEKLANALKVSMEYFFRPFSFDMSEINISFRKKSSVKAKVESSLVSKIQDKVERYLEIEKILSVDNASNKTEIFPVISSAAQMKELAKNIRVQWELGNAPIENAKELLIQHGIKVFEVDGPDGFDGVSGAANDSIWVIVLNNEKKHIERKRLTTLHEFAHLLANNAFDTTLSQNEKEKLCNVFASEMLLPSQVLVDTFGTKSKISFQELISLQCTYGISIDAIMYSLKSLSIISDKRHRSFCIQKNMNSKFKSEVEESRFKEKENSSLSDSVTYTNMVYSALAQKLITPSRAAELLSIPVSDVQSQSLAF